MTFQDRVFDEGTQTSVDRTVVVAGSEHFGLPTATDNDILLTLIHLTKVRNNFADKRVSFTRYELIRFLGWDGGGKSYKRLDEALQRWTSVTLHYKHAWWDRSGRKWRTRSFHVIESLELRGRDEVKDDGASTFTWNDVIFDSFKSGNLKRLDLNTYFGLKLAVSRQLYRFLDKRFYRSSRLEFSLRDFACEHIGLSRTYDTFEIKRKLQPAIEELESIGFLVPESAERRYEKVRANEWRITLRRANAKVIEEGTDSSMVTKLAERGISRVAAKRFASEFSASHLSEKIAIHDELLARHDPRISRNAAGFLAAAIRDDYHRPQSVSPKRALPVEPETRRNSFQPRTRSVAQAVESPSRDSAAREYFARLTPDEQAIVEANAVARGNRFQVESYHRLKASGGSLLDAVRMDLIAKYLEAEQVFRPNSPAE